MEQEKSEMIQSKKSEKRYFKEQRKRNRKLRGKSDRQLLIMSLPAMLKLLIFAYLPMVGIVMAFQDYSPVLGFFKSEFVGFKNFEFFFKSDDAVRVTRNTILMNLLFIVGGLVVSLTIALIMNEMRNKYVLKTVQTMMFVPYFISWSLVGIILTAFLESRGILTNAILQLTGQKLDFYTNYRYWTVILVVMNIWKGAGVSGIIYYANMLSIDKEYYEAAALDGANRLQCAWHITLPEMKTMITVLTVMSLGGIIRGDFGLFYFGTRNQSMLYPITDVIDTYVFRALSTQGDFAMASAVGLFQSVVGMILILSTNAVVRKVNRKAALY